MSNAIATQTKQFDLSPQTFDQALTFSKYLADSDLVPKDFKGKPGNCLIAMQWGAELGLKPMQAMQNLAVINGRPALWGDAVIALVRSSPLCEFVIETDDGHTATCRVKRRGEPEQVRTFSMDDARAAGLAGKQGPWAQYPKRMRQMRARAFALRDVFPDVLRGIPVAEELQDMEREQVQEKSMGSAERVDAPPPPQPWPADKWAAALPKVISGIQSGKTLDDALSWLRAKATVTQEQEQELRDAVAALAQPAGIDPERLAQAMRDCQSLDALYGIAAHIDSIDDEAERKRIEAVFDVRVKELEAIPA